MASEKDILARKKEVSERISAQVRTLSIGVLAFVWLLLYPGKDASTFPAQSSFNFLLWFAGTLALAALLLDFLQYVAAYMLTTVTLRNGTKTEGADADYKYDRHSRPNRLQIIFFWSKQASLGGSLVLLAVFLIIPLITGTFGQGDQAAGRRFEPCCSPRMEDDVAAIRRAIEAPPETRTNQLNVNQFSERVISVPGEGTIRSWASWTVWLFFGLCTVSFIGGVVLLTFKAPTMKAIGASLVTAATLSAGGFVLVKNLKIDSIFKFSLDKLVLQPSIDLRQQGALGPERLGYLDRFAIGDAKNIETQDKGRLPVANSDEISQFSRAWLQGHADKRDAVLLVIGATDRLPIRGAASRQFEANAGLAMARAETVKQAIVKRCKEIDPTCQLREDQVIALVSGPRHTPALDTAAADTRRTGFPEDRRVDVWALWTRRIPAK